MEDGRLPDGSLPMPNATMSSPRDLKRRRAAAACTVCHRRKVRCNAAVTIPCSNCVQDGEECVLHVSGRGKHKRVKVSALVQDRGPSLDVAFRTPQYDASPGLVQESAIRHHGGRPPSPPTPLPTASNAPPISDEEKGANAEAYKNIVDPPSTRNPLVPFYVGESQGLRLVFNVAKDSILTSNAHFLVERPARIRLAPEDLQFLEAKGAFSIPSHELCMELLDLYFHYVHPLLPVVEPSSFLTRYERGGSSSVSLLLLQSMFFAASSFLAPELLVHFGASSTKALKRQFYQRAKALYDLDYEIDKIPLIQALLLMGYWYGNTHDRADSWHWVGIATSLSQTVGLHRDPGRSNIPDRQRRLWKRLWWCCSHRDSWISLGMGRPTRISKDDCDVGMLKVEDLIDPNPPLDLSDNARALIDKCNSLAILFVEMARLSSLLADILGSQYAADPSKRSLEKAQMFEDDLQRWWSDLDPRLKIDLSIPVNQDSLVSTLHKHVLHVFFQVTVITLHRPLIFQAFDRLRYPEGDSPSDAAFEKSVFAASAATDSYRKLIDLNLSRRLPPESVTTLISIISILFLEKFSAVGLKRQIAAQKLELTTMVIEELIDKYWAARFVQRYFKAAFEKIESAARRQHEGEGSRLPTPKIGSSSIQALTNRRDQGIGQPFTPPSDSAIYNSTFSPDMMLNDLGFMFEAADLFNMLE